MTAKKIIAIAAVAIATAGLAACGGTGAVAQLGALKRVARTCPAHAQVAAYVAWDVRRELRGRQIEAARLASLEKTAQKVAVCGGELRVVAFGATAGSTARLFDGELRPRGATENARLLRVPGLVDRATGHVEKALPGALAEISGQGADPVSQLAAAEQFGQQLGTGYALHVVIETSGLIHGFSNTRNAAAPGLISDAAVPDLSGADVVIAGIGKVGRGAPVASPVVVALRTFYGDICRRTRAESCLAITDLAPLEG